METVHLYFLCASLLSLCSFRVFAAPASGPNSAKVPGNTKDELSRTGLAEQLAKSSTQTNGNMLTDDFDDEYLTSAMLEFGDMDRDGLLDSDEIFRFYLAVVRFPMKKASDTAQSFIDLGDSNKDGKLSLREMLKIMDEAKHLAEVRRLMQIEAEKQKGEAKTHSEAGEGNKLEDQKPSEKDQSSEDNRLSDSEGHKQLKQKSDPPKEENVEELHNLNIAMK